MTSAIAPIASNVSPVRSMTIGVSTLVTAE